MFEFGLDETQREKFREWYSNHPCNGKYAGAIGGALTYSFTPTSLGIVTKVQCGFPLCQEVLDLSDYENW